MTEFAARFADLLEATADKVRSMTVDRAARAVRIAMLGLPLLTLVLLAVVFLFMTVHGALAVPLGAGGAHSVLAGLFLVIGWFVWTKQAKDRT